MADCLTRQGFPARFIADAQGGSVEWASTDAQQVAADEARSTCNQELIDRGLVGSAATPSLEELQAAYASLDAVRSCLIAEGYSMAPAPSEASFLTSGGQWTPYADLPAIIPDDVWERLNRECPQPV